MAYTSGPRKWFTQYKQLTAVKFRSSVSKITAHLLNNALNTPDILAADKVAKDIASLLRSEWGLLAVDFRIKKPQLTATVSAGWSALEEYFPVKGKNKNAGEVIRELLNVPYGYDYNTLSLLIAAFCGFYRHDLEFSKGGQLESIRTLSKDLKPREFIELVAALSIRRSDADAIRDQVRQLLQQVDRGVFTKTKAEEALQVFSEAVGRDDVDQKPAIEAAVTKLTGLLEQANKYDELVSKVDAAVRSASALSELGRVLVSVSKMQAPESVRPDSPPPSEIRKHVVARIDAVAKDQCDRWKKLNSIADYKLNEQRLLGIRETVRQVQLPDLVEYAVASLRELKSAKDDIERRQSDEAAIGLLKGMEGRGTWNQLSAQLADVGHLHVFSDAAQKLAAEKRQLLTAELKRLEEYAATRSDVLGTIGDRATAESLEADLLRHIGLFEGSPMLKEIEAALEKCKKLKEFFEILVTASHGVLNSPEDAREKAAMLQKLPDRFGDLLGSAQLAALTDTIGVLEREVKNKEQLAIRWLDQADGVLKNGGKLDELRVRLQSPPPFLPEGQRERLQLLIKGVEQQAQIRQQEATALGTLRSISTKGALAELEAQRAMVDSIIVPTAEVRQLRETKLAAIDQEIKKLHAFTRDLPNRLAAVSKTHMAETLHSEILRYAALFEGSVQLKEIDEALEKCKKLKEFFEILGNTSQGGLTSPEDAREKAAVLQKLPDRFGDLLGSAQRVPITDALGALEREVEKKEQLAIRWLDQADGVLKNGGKLDELRVRLQSPPPFLPEGQRERLQLLIKGVEQQVQIRQQEATALGTLRSISTKGALAELEAQRAMVDSIIVPTAEVRQLRETKLAAIDQEIEKLQAFTRDLPNRLAAVVTVRAAEDLQSDILRHIGAFEHSVHEKTLGVILDDCRRIRTVLDSLEYQRTRPLNTPAEADERIHVLNSLLTEHPGLLSSLQVSAINDALTTISNDIGNRENEAVRWLAQIETGLANGEDFYAVAEKLSNPPPFLPDDQKIRLNQVTAEINRRIDDDQVQNVVFQFKKITDFIKRMECFNQIQALVESHPDDR
jgi:hypothetical protein